MADAAKLKLLECVLCAEKFSEMDVKEELFYPSTSICRGCYRKGQKMPRAAWCFGKPDKVRHGKIVEFAFNPKARECQSECPDRAICTLFVARRKKKEHR